MGLQTLISQFGHVQQVWDLRFWDKTTPAAMTTTGKTWKVQDRAYLVKKRLRHVAQVQMLKSTQIDDYSGTALVFIQWTNALGCYYSKLYCSYM